VGHFSLFTVSERPVELHDTMEYVPNEVRRIVGHPDNQPGVRMMYLSEEVHPHDYDPDPLIDNLIYKSSGQASTPCGQQITVYGLTASTSTQDLLRHLHNADVPRIFVDLGNFGEALATPTLPGHVMDGVRHLTGGDGFQYPAVDVCGKILVRDQEEPALQVQDVLEVLPEAFERQKAEALILDQSAQQLSDVREAEAEVATAEQQVRDMKQDPLHSKFEWAAARYRAAQRKVTKAEIRAERLNSIAIAEEKRADIQEEMNQTMWELDILRELAEIRAKEAEEKRIREEGTELPWRPIPKDRTIAVNLIPTESAEYNAEVLDKLHQAADRMLVAKAFAEASGGHRLDPKYGLGPKMMHVLRSEPEEPEEQEDPHTYYPVYIHGVDERMGIDGQPTTGFWIEIEDEEGGEEYPAVWVPEEAMVFHGEEHPLVEEFLDNANESKKRQADVENCVMEAQDLGQSYMELEKRVIENIGIKDEDRRQPDHHKYKYECKYLYKIAVEE